MSEIVVGRTDHVVDVGLILAEHRAAIVVRVRIGVGIDVNETVVVGDELELHGEVGEINAVDTIHCLHDCRHSVGDRAAEELCVLACCGQRQAIGAHVRAGRGLRSCRADIEQIVRHGRRRIEHAPKWIG